MKKAMIWLLILALIVSLNGCGDGEITDLSINYKSVTLHAPGETVGLEVVTIPAASDVTIEFESSNPAVAVISDRGLITAVAEGQTTITVICGKISRFCEVVCDFDEAEPPTTPTETSVPETTEPVCADCGGKGVCRNCGGDPTCDSCNGRPVCTKCKDDPGKCSGCNGTKGKVCIRCDGEWKCSKCDGNGDCGMCGGSLKCSKCGGTGLKGCGYCKQSGDCRICEGTGQWESGRRCSNCNATGKCHYCKGDGKLDCTGCDDGVCSYCDGDDECYNCGGDGSVCSTCEKGFDPCDRCGGTGACTACQGEPVCQTCNGSGLICQECDKGLCRTCGGKNAPASIGQNQNTATVPEQDPADPQTQIPDSNSGIQENPTPCFTCGGDEFCIYCDSGICKKSNCLFGRVDCTSCDAGQCRRCSGLGYNISTEKDCPYCYNGNCTTCDGMGDKDCPYCNDGGYCKRCDGSGWCPTCDGTGYIG